MAIQGLVVTNQIVAALALLARSEANAVLAHSDVESYIMFRTLLEACRQVFGAEIAPRVHAAVDRLSLIALAPTATIWLLGLEHSYENGLGGNGIPDIKVLWLELQGRTAYTPQLHGLPWGFIKSSTRK